MAVSRHLLYTGALLLGVASLALAHGHDDAPASSGEMDMTEEGGMKMAPEDFSELMVPNYFGHAEHRGLMYAHIALSVLGWLCLLPLAVMLSVARSRISLIAQVAFHVVNGLSILTATIYNASTPDLYPHNMHHIFSWVLSIVTLGWTALGLVNIYAGAWRHSTSPSVELPLAPQSMAEYQAFKDLDDAEKYRWSRDSGQGTSIASSSRTHSMNSESGQLPHRVSFPAEDEQEEIDLSDTSERHGFLRNTAVDRFLSSRVTNISSTRALTLMNVVYTVFERLLLVLGSFALCSGIVTYGGIFRGTHVFNGLAHFIKGGIFFWYGLLTLGRWMGSFADFGWAWNVKPGADIVGRTRARIPSAEFTESFVIFLYGASNVFLEHLSAWGRAWTAMDLEHVSITIMFFGGGALGMLIESSTIRKLLNSTVQADESKLAAPQKHSLNPIPALVIMLLGLMMSGHHQHSPVSSAIHKQWGMLFVGFALARGFTYVMFWLKPPTSFLPARPPTELISSFCLVSGGMIFMASNKDTVWVLELHQLDAMFIFTVMMGLTSLILAWAMLLTGVKGWATQRERRLSSSRQ